MVRAFIACVEGRCGQPDLSGFCLCLWKLDVAKATLMLENRTDDLASRFVCAKARSVNSQYFV